MSDLAIQFKELNMTSLEADKLKAEINLMLSQMYEINETNERRN